MTYPKPFVRKIIFVIIVMTFLLGFGIDLYSPSFPSIVQKLKTTEQLVQLTIATYFGGYVLGLLIMGPTLDTFGRRRPLIYGLIFYTIMSLLCSISKTIEMLLFFRFLQGIGVASVGVSFRSVLSDLFSGKQLAKGMNYSSMSYRIGPIIAPLIGGYLTVYFGWESNFYFLAAYSAFLVGLIYFLLPETHNEQHPFHFSYVASRYKHILSCLPFVGGAICVGTTYGMMIVFNVVGPFFIQDVLGYSPIFYGHIAFLLGCMAFLGIMINRFLLHYFEVESIIRAGIYIILGLCFLLLVLAYLFPVNLYAFCVPVGFILLATGLTNSNAQSISMEFIEYGKGTASGIFAVILIATTSLFTALSSFLKSNTIIPFAYGFLGMILIALLSYLILFRRRQVEK